MQKYLIPKTLVEASYTYSVTTVGMLTMLTIEYLEKGFYDKEIWEPYETEFAPIRAEIDAANKKPQSKPLEQRKTEFYNDVGAYLGEYERPMLVAFCRYWSEHKEGGKKMLFEMKPTFNIKQRLRTWKSNEKPTIQNERISKSNELDDLLRESIANLSANNG